MLAFEKTVDFSKGQGKSFTDVNSQSWAYDFIRKASRPNIVMGYGSDFRPTTHATHAQSMVMIHRALQQENSALPKDADLSTFLSGYIKKENDFMEAKDANKLAVLYSENGTGLFKAEKRETIEWLFYEEPGTKTTTKINDDNLKLTFVKKANRFATVKATGMIFNIKIEGSNYKTELTETMDIQYNLKKDPTSGKWKIYNSHPFYDEEAVMSMLNGQILSEE